MAPPRKRALPKPLPEGFLLTDTEKKRWMLGKVIGQGGFGLIYLASQDVDTPVAADSDFVIKIEYHENGPLFSELKFYQRAAKPESMQRWTEDRKLDFLGIPTYWGSGLAEHNGTRYRFMAMDRLGSDLQKACQHNGGRLKKATVLQLGRRLVDVLEYIHDNEYVHADIKAANLMLGHRDPDQVYLADYGLSYRYCPDGVHKEYKENPKKGHDGTIEYTSLDAHNGVAPSRRGDLQILGFCLLHWLCGTLPWDALLKNPTQVQEAKARLMDNLPGSVQNLSQSGTSTDELAKFLLYVKSLGYQERPDYHRLRDMLASGSQGRIDLSRPTKGQTQGSTSDEPPARGKKAGRGSSKPKAVAMEIDEDDPPIPRPQSEQKAGKVTAPVRRSPRTKPAPVRVDEDSSDSEDEDEKARPKPIDARYIRGPPVTPRCHVDDDGDDGDDDDDGAVRRSPRTKPAPVRVDEDSFDSEDDEEERPKPIDPRYIRGPPIGPRPQTKPANPRSHRPLRKTTDGDVIVTTVRREVKRRPRPHAMANDGLRSQRPGEMIIKHTTVSYRHAHWDELQGLLDYDPNGQRRGVDDHYGKPFCGPREGQWDAYGSGEYEGSPVKGSVVASTAPEQCRRDGRGVLLYCTVFMGLAWLFLVAVGATR